MSLNIMKDKYVFGGLISFSRETLDVRINQINDKFRLHTCYFYGDALKVINKASKEVNIKPNLIIKLYFNINFFWMTSKPKVHRFASCYDQLRTIIDELGFIPNDVHLEICGNVPLKNINNFEFLKFKEKVQKEFNVSKFFLETFPEWEVNTKKILKTNFFDGSLFHANILEKGFFDEVFLKYKFLIISPLSGGGDLTKTANKKNMVNEKIYSDYINFCKDITGYKSTIELNIAFANTFFLNPNFQYFITATSTLKNYNSLKILFSNKSLLIKDKDLKNIWIYRKKYLDKIHRENPYGLFSFFL